MSENQMITHADSLAACDNRELPVCRAFCLILYDILIFRLQS